MSISEKSRHYTLVALDELKEIRADYPSLQKIEEMDKKTVRALKDSMRSFFESVKKIGYTKFSFWNDSKDVRNFLAHTTGETPDDEIFLHFRKFFAFLENAENELNKNLEKSYSQNKEIRKFEKFGSQKFGNESERKHLSQSIAETLDDCVPDGEKLPFPKTQGAKEAEKFFETKSAEQKELLDFAKNHSELNGQIQTEILQTIQSAYDETEITDEKNPFFLENLFVHKTQRLSDSDLLKNLSALKDELCKTETGKNNFADFGFYEKQYGEICKKADSIKSNRVSTSRNDKTSSRKDGGSAKNAEEIEREKAALSRNLKKDLRVSLEERFSVWQLSEIDKKRKSYLEELYKKIAQFKKLENLLSPFIKNFGRLWDLSSGVFGDFGFEILKDFADLLENDKSLKELADLIGRQEAEKERLEKEIRDKIEVKAEFFPKAAFRGQISGLRLSGEISSALPSELALSQNPTAKLYFAQKFAEKKMLSYAYTKFQKKLREEHIKEEIEVRAKETERKGPVIICVDTSGSMNGTPERIAKTISFALARKCLEETRKCYLVSFSTEIEVQDLSDFEKSNGLAELAKFLRKSFCGGTDASPALEKSLELLQSNEWKNADVLVASDMVMGEFSKNLVDSINAQKEKLTKFYSLVIGSSGNKNIIDCFDENWTYDADSRDSMRRLVRHISGI